MRFLSTRFRRLLLGAAIAAVAAVAALFAADRLIGALDLFGVNYPKETLRWRTEMTELKLTRPDGSLDLDGVLFMQKPGASAQLGSFGVHVNALGFRGPEISIPKPAGTYRILALGDSVTFGWGVEDEVTFVRRLERALNEQIEGMRFEVVNTGHPMFDTVQELALLREHGLRLDPDLVLLTFVVNDVEPTRDLAEALLELQAHPPAPPSGPGAWFRGRFAAWLPSLHSLWEHYTLYAGAYERPEGAPEPPGPEETETGARGWERSKKALLEMRDLCAERAIPFLVLDHTYPPIRSLRPFCEENGIRWFDLRFTAEELAMPIYNSVRDPHANALGHAILLEKLERALREAGLFDLR